VFIQAGCQQRIYTHHLITYGQATKPVLSWSQVGQVLSFRWDAYVQPNHSFAGECSQLSFSAEKRYAKRCQKPFRTAKIRIVKIFSCRIGCHCSTLGMAQRWDQTVQHNKSKCRVESAKETYYQVNGISNALN